MLTKPAWIFGYEPASNRPSFRGQNRFSVRHLPFRLMGGINKATKSSNAMGRTHEPGEAIFRSILPEDIEWKQFPAFPPEARLAVLVGEPDEPGPYVVRVKVPSGVKLMPHKHPEDRVYTVMSGVFYIGL